MFKINTKASLLSLAHWTMLYVETSMKINLLGSWLFLGCALHDPAPQISSPWVGSNGSLNHKVDQLTLQTAWMSNIF